MADLTATDVENINSELALTRAQRIRLAMFPESLEEGTAIPSVSIDSDNPTALQRLAEPSQMLRIAIRNLINYQSDAATARYAVPELTLLLQDRNEDVINKTALTVHKLAKKDASRSTLAANAELVRNLVETLQNSSNIPTLREAAGALSHLSKDPNGRLAIFQSYGIPILLQMLKYTDRNLVIYALTTLHNLLRYQAGAKDEVLHYEGLPEFFKFLAIDNLKLLAVIINCLCILVQYNDDGKIMLLEANVHYRLVELITSENIQYEKLLWVSTRLLYIMGAMEPAKPEMIRAGVLQASLTQLDLKVSDRVVRNCLFLLLNVSEAATVFENNHLINYLKDNLQSDQVEIIFCALGALSNFTCNNTQNKYDVYVNGGVEDLLNALKVTVDHDGCVLAAVATLRHITAMYEKAAVAQNEVRLNHGINVVMDLLSSSANPELSENLIGLLRHLSLCRQNHDEMLGRNVVEVLKMKIQFLEEQSKIFGDSRHQKLIKVAYATIYELTNDETILQSMKNVENEPEFGINDHVIDVPEYTEDSQLLPPTSPQESNMKILWADTQL